MMKRNKTLNTNLKSFLLATKEAASFLRLSVNGLRNLVEKGEIVRVKLGHRVLYRRDDLLEYIDKCTERIRKVEDLMTSTSV